MARAVDETQAAVDLVTVTTLVSALPRPDDAEPAGHDEQQCDDRYEPSALSSPEQHGDEQRGHDHDQREDHGDDR